MSERQRRIVIRPSQPPWRFHPEAEELSFSLINSERRRLVSESKGRLVERHGLLQEAARKHASELARRRMLDHDSADGRTTLDRVLAEDVRVTACGENLGCAGPVDATRVERTVEEIHRGFMSEPAGEPNHRTNLLYPDFTHVGVGVVVTSDGWLYLVQDFAGLYATNPPRSSPGRIGSLFAPEHVKLIASKAKALDELRRRFSKERTAR